MAKAKPEIVFCYRNLNRKGIVWSVRQKSSGLVIDRSNFVALKHVIFKVSEAGRKRVLLNRKKNVHAGVEGIRIKSKVKLNSDWVKVTYDPYNYDSFVIVETFKKVKSADMIILKEDGLWALNPN